MATSAHGSLGAPHALVQRLGLSFPIGYGADADHVAALIGSFTNPQPHYLQPSNFILTPEGKVLNAMYSTNAMGRITAQEAIRLVRFVNARAKAA